MKRLFLLPTLFALVFAYNVDTVKGSCGNPGWPENGDVVLPSNNSSPPIARYECPGSYIVDGDAERICRPDGNWSGVIPRCALKVRFERGEENAPDISKLNDTNMDTCDWFHAGRSLSVAFQSQSIDRVTIISPVNYKELLQMSQWEIEVLDGGTVVQRQNRMIFQETEVTLATDQFSSIRSPLSASGDAIRLKLVKEEAYVCELMVHALQDKCGDPDQPKNGKVTWDGKGATCECDPGFHLSDPSAMECSNGRWTGSQCTCQLISYTPWRSGPSIGFAVSSCICLCILSAVIYISRKYLLKIYKNAAAPRNRSLLSSGRPEDVPLQQPQESSIQLQ